LVIAAHVRVWQQRPGEFHAKTDRGADAFRLSIRLDSWTPRAAPTGPTTPVQPPGVNVAEEPPVEEPARRDPMDRVRDISIRFFKLTLSQKSAIAGKLNLLEEEDTNQPDFERFRRVFVRAQNRGLVNDLDREVTEAAARGR
jgi:hypothetical protein